MRLYSVLFSLADGSGDPQQEGDEEPIDIEGGLGLRAFEVDNPDHDGLCDLDTSGVPMAWRDGDPDIQDQLTRRILSRERRRIEDAQKYAMIPHRRMKLSKFRQLYEHRNDAWHRQMAIQMLKRRITVEVDSDLQYEWDDADLLWGIAGVSYSCVLSVVHWHMFMFTCKVYLDLRLLMSNRPGLDALLPRCRLPGTDPLFTLKLVTNQRRRCFYGTIDWLPFDPTGRLLYIGSVRQIEHAFLILVPREQVGRPCDDSGMKVYKDVSPMDAKSSRALFVMLGHMLDRIGHRAIYSREYPPIEKDSDISEYLCNIL